RRVISWNQMAQEFGRCRNEDGTPKYKNMDKLAKGTHACIYYYQDEIRKVDENIKQDQITAFIRQYPSGNFTQAAKARLIDLQSKPPVNAVVKVVPTPPVPVIASTSANTVLVPIEKVQVADVKPLEPAPPTTVAVKLNIKPWGAIYVDDKQKGVSPPMKKMLLSEGKHQVRVVNSNFPDYVTEIQVSTKKLGSIEHDFTLPKK
ncbi:MAG: PEGA domain-containing protein, partial [Pseudomonadota bacterium]